MDKRSVIVPPLLHAPSSQLLPHAITIAAPPSCNHHRCPSIWGIWLWLGSSVFHFQILVQLVHQNILRDFIEQLGVGCLER
ncbi:hypothetical protein JHK87_004542 [Glycine soja]|nr:hypothetical protein JHK87_004542 [Glycine soja]